MLNGSSTSFGNVSKIDEWSFRVAVCGLVPMILVNGAHGSFCVDGGSLRRQLPHPPIVLERVFAQKHEAKDDEHALSLCHGGGEEGLHDGKSNRVYS